MDLKDIILIVIAALGWLWGIIQFFINRKNHTKDKLVDRRYDAYKGYMVKYEEIVNSYRKNPITNNSYGIPSELLQKMLTGDEDDINNALLEYNNTLYEVVKSSCEPILIIKQELNALRLVCSLDLLVMIEALDSLVNDFNEQTIFALEALKRGDMNILNQMKESFMNNDKWLGFEKLNNAIIELMRKEIGSN